MIFKKGCKKNMEKFSIFDISDWFLSKETMIPKKLQALSYYFVAWEYALFDTSSISDTTFQAWVNSPISPELYNQYREYGWNNIEQKQDNSKLFDSKTLELLESVWLTYGDKSANELEALARSEYPWKNARKDLKEREVSNRKIEVKDMKEYYRSIYIGS